MINRRAFLQNVTGAAVAVASSSIRCDETPPASRIVDTHTHFYDPLRKEGVPWPSKGTPLYRQVLPKDWLAVASPHGVKETVVVEASDWFQDNAWVLNLAAKEPSIIGFVGHLLPHQVRNFKTLTNNVDNSIANSLDFAAQLKRFAANPIFRGIRVNSPDFLKNVDEADFQSGVKLMADLGLALDLNGSAEAHLVAAKLAADMPALRIVINHVGSAGDAAQLTAEWRAGIAALGKQKNVFCKVSAMMEQTKASDKEFGKAPRDTAYYAPILDHCWEVFGEDRLAYGSNWPVSDKGGAYADQFKIVNEYFTAKGREVCEKFFWKNSREAYRWVERAGK